MTSGDADRRARFDGLVRSAYVPLRRYLARRADPGVVDDVLSDTLLVMWRRLDDIPAHATLPWCYGAARRCLANSRRAQDRHRRLLHRLRAQSDANPEPVWELDPQDEASRGLAEAMAGLSKTDRDVLRLWAWEQLAPAEVALVLGITANAASIRLHRAIGRLRAGYPTEVRRDAPRKDAASAGHPEAAEHISRAAKEAPR